MYHRLGSPLHYQLANTTRDHQVVKQLLLLNQNHAILIVMRY